MFERLAEWTGETIGTARAFGVAVILTLSWAASGPFLHFSNTWQLIINTSTTIMTWLMVFLLQHTQNRDTKHMQELLEEIREKV